MTGRRIQLRGFTLGKDGKRVTRDERRLSASARLKQRGSQKIRVKRGK